MSETIELFRKSKVLSLTYIAHMRILKVQPSKDHPDGFKVNFVIVDTEKNKPVFLIDSHEPFGYHFHPTPDKDHSIRVPLDVSDPFEALSIFEKKMKEYENK